MVYAWCRRAGLQDCDAADVVQEVFRAVFQHLKDFQARGGVFHAWLGKITANQVRQYFRQQRRLRLACLGQQAVEVADPAPSPEWESEWEHPSCRQQVIQRALELIRTEFTSTTWECFVRTTLQGQSSVDVAAYLGMNPNAVRQARYRVLHRLRQELEGLL
jgi:RNA polymerase sigma-70 factor (ECF subfamily)